MSEEITKVPKKRGRPRKNPETATQLVSSEKASRYVRNALVAWDLDPIDTSDIEQVEARAREYLIYCAEQGCLPNKATLSSWIGIHRTTLNSWQRGEYRKETHYEFAKKVDMLCESVLVELMEDNSIHPGIGCFLLKNHSGYQDRIDIAPVQNNPLGPLPDPEELRKRIEANCIED